MRVRLLLLTQGDAETRDSWSGSAKSLVDHLRAAGHDVTCGDVDLYGADRALTALLSFAPRRKRWATRFHLGPAPFARRSARARRRIEAVRGDVEVILQIGAANAPSGRGELPYALYCDSNILLARHVASAERSISDLQELTPAEVAGVEGREAAVYRDASAIFTMSERLRRSFIEDFDLDPQRVHTIHAGPNFDVERIPSRGARDPGAPPTILFVGRAFERKGGDLLLRVFERVRESLPEARLLIVGPTDLAVDQPGVECPGFLDKDTEAGWQGVLDAYAQADVYCLPTRFEPFGISYLEAMFFGLPCLGPDAWAVPEMIRHGETGFLVPPDDEAAYHDRLVELLRDPGRAAEMGRAGRALASGHFTWEATVDRMMNRLEPLVARGANALR